MRDKPRCCPRIRRAEKNTSWGGSCFDDYVGADVSCLFKGKLLKDLFMVRKRCTNAEGEGLIL